MVRGGCLPIRGSKGMKWKYDDNLCVCVCVGQTKQRYMYFLGLNVMTWQGDDG